VLYQYAPDKLAGVTQWKWRLLAFVALAIAWQIVAAVIGNVKIWPDLRHVFENSIPEIALFGGAADAQWGLSLETIGMHTLYTVVRIIVGLTFGGVLGLVCGFAVHFFSYTKSANKRLLDIIRGVPLFALIPLFLFWFGGNEQGILAYIVFGVAVVLATNTYEALCNVPSSYMHQARLLGANRVQVFSTVYLFAIQPQLSGGLRNVIGLAWAFSLGAEYLSANSGLGYLVYQSYLYADMGKLAAFAVLYGVLGTLSFYLSKLLLSRMQSWQPEI
jgi:ABC-type nitrate/sulfonate/bicarbonate transport system permease component